MRLFAIADLHLAHAVNRAAFAELPPHPQDWLIIAGDIAERLDLITEGFSLAREKFARVIWAPGNHDLWTTSPPGSSATGPESTDAPSLPLRGEAKYRAIIASARALGVDTPEDPYPVWDGPGGPCLIAPLFLLYDYSFRPPDVAREDVVAWAREGRAVCADEIRLDPSPHPSREAWCAARLALTEARLEASEPQLPKVLVNHYPLRADLVRIPRIPRFTPWCGTQATQDWHRRFNARVAIHGHLHVRRTDWRDGTRFEEVSLGYPRQWRPERGVATYLRQILPAPL